MDRRTAFVAAAPLGRVGGVHAAGGRLGDARGGGQRPAAAVAPARRCRMAVVQQVDHDGLEAALKNDSTTPLLVDFYAPWYVFFCSCCCGVSPPPHAAVWRSRVYQGERVRVGATGAAANAGRGARGAACGSHTVVDSGCQVRGGGDKGSIVRRKVGRVSAPVVYCVPSVWGRGMTVVISSTWGRPVGVAVAVEGALNGGGRPWVPVQLGWLCWVMVGEGAGLMSCVQRDLPAVVT